MTVEESLKRIRFSRSIHCPFSFQVGEQVETAIWKFEFSFSGRVQEPAGMVVNLSEIDSWLAELSVLRASAAAAATGSASAQTVAMTPKQFWAQVRESWDKKRSQAELETLILSRTQRLIALSSDSL